MLVKRQTSLILAVLMAIGLFTSVAIAQHSDHKKTDDVKLKKMDATEAWKYPFLAPDETKRKLLSVLDEFKDTVSVGDLLKRLGKPDRIDDLASVTKPLSHFESGFMNGSKDKYSYRCIWFVRKTSKSPGLGDSWLAAYVDSDGTTVSVIHSNWLKK